ncbi:trypsin-like peptidase domain-containing protein [Rhizobium sp. RAF56]|uniref:trypsin-like peptidase domain-containing protein n=1 Tax=Rhizobium sp. RAF56 TaxID=3233062 RepID=UPI003F9B00F5
MTWLLQATLLAFFGGAAWGAESGLPSLAPMLERVAPAVVSISVKGKTSDDNPVFLTPGKQSESPENDAVPFHVSMPAGTGVITDARHGYILTNNHVIAGATAIKVTVADGATYDAFVTGTDEQSDLAVIRIKAEGLKAVELGDSSALKVGDYVVAIGSPFGLNTSVTFGIVSALDRIRPEFGAGLIQTDASLNPGSSGGALVDIEGKVIGINTAIIASDGGNAGIGFAVPINEAKAIMEQLIAKGTIQRGQLGVQVQDSSRDFGLAFGVEATTGALVNDVTPGSPGAKAGVLVGDIIAKVNGIPVADSTDLRTRVSAFPPGATIKLLVLRRAGNVEIAATLATLVNEVAESSSEFVDGKGLLASLTLQATGSDEGAIVASLSDDSVAAAAGLQPGDIITTVNRKASTTPQMVVDLSKSAKDVLLLGILRGNSKSFVVVKPKNSG